MKHKLLSLLINLILILGSIGAVISFPAQVSATGNTYYVATTGSDAANGSLATPWLTPQHAANTMVAGDTCNIEAGTYGASNAGQRIMTVNNGSAGSPITFQSYNGTVTIFSSGLFSNLVITNTYNNFIGITFDGDINATYQSYCGAAFGAGAGNNILQNCTFQNYNVGGINMDAATIAGVGYSNITIDGCIFNNNNTTDNEECVDINYCTTVEIKNCTIMYTGFVSGYRGGISTTGSNYVSIHNNTIHDVSGVGIYPGPGTSTHPNAGSNISIYDNLIYNCGQAGINWSDEQGTSQTTVGINIYNNIIYNCHGAFEIDNPGSGTMGTVAITFINNTCYNNGLAREVLIVPTHTHFSSCVIRNNIFMNSAGGIYAIDYSDYVNGGFTVDHNLFYNSGGAWHAGNVLGTSYQQGNPNLSSPTTSFTLTSISTLAINTASATEAPSTDYIGTIRPQDGGWDIGAYEYTTVLSAVPFFQNITLSETGSTAFTYLPMGVAFNTSSIIGSGYMAANSLDSSVYDNGTALPTMFTNSSILFVDSIDPTGSSGSTFTDVLKTGQTPKSSMPIIVGNNGYVTTADNAALEPVNNFSIAASGYLNTTAGASKNIVSKSGALQVYVDPTTSGTIDVIVPNSGNYVSPGTLSPSVTSTSWTNAAYAYDNNLGTYALYSDAGGGQSYMFTITNSATLCDQIVYTASTGFASDSIEIDAYYTSAWHTIYTGTNDYGGGSNVPGTWTINLPSYPSKVSVTGVRFQFTGSTYADDYEMNEIYYASNPFLSVSGISSGIHTITTSETTAAGGTLSLQVDSGTPSTITGVGSVPDTANAWIIDQNNVMPYMTSYTETVGGTEKIKYQPITVISGTVLPNLDSSGSYPGAITFGTNNTAVIVGLSGSFGPLTPASYNSSNNYGPQTPGSINLGNPIQPQTMYTGLDSSKFPFGSVIDAILDAGQVPHALFWYPFIFLFIVIVSMLGYDATQSTGGQGSLLTQCIIAEVLLVIFGVLGDTGVTSLIPLWPAFLFPLPAAAMIMSRRHVGWG